MEFVCSTRQYWQLVHFNNTQINHSSLTTSDFIQARSVRADGQTLFLQHKNPEIKRNPRTQWILQHYRNSELASGCVWVFTFCVTSCRDKNVTDLKKKRNIIMIIIIELLNIVVVWLCEGENSIENVFVLIFSVQDIWGEKLKRKEIK